MGRLFECELIEDFYSCRACSAHLAYISDIISKHFRGRYGRAYLFDTVINVNCGVLEDKKMITGKFTVVDVYCNKCHRLLGWKYVRAYHGSQKFKEGRFVIECRKIKPGGGNIFLNQPAYALNNANYNGHINVNNAV